MRKDQADADWRHRWGNVLLLAGGALLVSFVVFKGWSAQQSLAGLEAFEAAKSQARLRAGDTDRIVPAAHEPSPAMPTDRATTSAREVFRADPESADTSTWSAQRISDWESAVAKGGDAPDAVLSIEPLDIRVPVFNGATDLNLNRGVARIIGTGRIGEPGNLGIAGHRDGFFRPLKDIKIGDRLTLETLDGTEEYAVASIDIVDPSALHVLAPTETPSVTLVTCYPFYHVGNAPQRFIVRAERLNNQVDLQRRRS
jgi:LPXTG-site transpeptidase (sortase) family protein